MITRTLCYAPDGTSSREEAQSPSRLGYVYGESRPGTGVISAVTETRPGQRDGRQATRGS